MRNFAFTSLILTLIASFATAAEDYRFDEVLYSGMTDSFRSGRSLVTVDPILSDLARGTLVAPKEGDSAGNDYEGNPTNWTAVEMDEKGVFQMDRAFGGYIYLRYDSDKEETVLLRSDGNTELIVNGVHRVGDYYSKSWVILPVKLKKGKNEFWYKVGRGRTKSLVMEKPRNPVFLSPVDATLPDLLTSEIDEKWGAIRVINTTDRTLNNLRIISDVAGKTSNTRIRETVTPRTGRKIPFKLQDGSNGIGNQAAQIRLYQNDKLIDEVVIELEVKEPTRNYRRTFISEIDGSLQYYGVREGQAETGRKPAMFLSVHGAGVQAIRQAGSYQNKDWGHVIAPTNRREFGFSWEDWGRWDAMEVLEHAESAYGTDPERTYLTGHSMGGHGTWHLGATFPDRWAAISPMAGWRSFFSYTRSTPEAPVTPMEKMLARAANPSRTIEMMKNYHQHGVFIEHGDADTTVRVSEARFMREELAKYHPSLGYHEEPGGGHWYGVDHDRAFNFFRDHEKTDIRDLGVLEFRIANPGVNATNRYITLYQQEKVNEYCGVVAEQTIRSRRQRRNDEDLSERTMEIATENLQTFRIDLAHCMHLESFTLSVDNQSIDDLPWPSKDHVWLSKANGLWQVTDTPNDPFEKNPVRYGGIKDAFKHRFVLVYSTGGDEAENDWSYHKARFDAETFYYRGNSGMDVIPDSDFSLEAYKDRSVILYGNASTNKAWPLLLKDSPVHIKRGQLDFGNETYKGSQYGMYMVRPRPDSETASVGVVAGTGLEGMAAANPNRYFISGPGFPDLVIMTPEMFDKGLEGIVAAGYFGNDWSVESGDFAFGE